MVDTVTLNVHGLRDGEETHIRRIAKYILHLLNAHLRAKDFEANPSRVNHANGLHQALLERATNSHNFANALHARTNVTVDLAREFGEIPLRNLRHDVVQGGLEASGGRLGHGVGKLRKCVAKCELRGGVCERVAGCFRCESGRAGKAGIDFDDAVFTIVGVERVLNVTLANDTKMTDDLYPRISTIFVH